MTAEGAVVVASGGNGEQAGAVGDGLSSRKMTDFETRKSSHQAVESYSLLSYILIRLFDSLFRNLVFSTNSLNIVFGIAAA